MTSDSRPRVFVSRRISDESLARIVGQANADVWPDDMPPGNSLEDEPSPDDRAARNAELTGMDLIQRELGGQVIGEFEG